MTEVCLCTCWSYCRRVVNMNYSFNGISCFLWLISEQSICLCVVSLLWINEWLFLCSSRFILIPLQWFLSTFVACQWNWPPITRGFHLFSDYAICFVENSQTNTIIGRIDCKSVHGSGSSTKKLVMLNFIVTQFFVSTVVDALPSTADRWMGWSLLLMAKMLGASWIE